MWKFERLNDEEKAEVKRLFYQADYKALATLLRSASVMPPGSCEGCQVEHTIHQWVTWAINEKKI